MTLVDVGDDDEVDGDVGCSEEDAGVVVVVVVAAALLEADGDLLFRRRNMGNRFIKLRSMVNLDTFCAESRFRPRLLRLVKGTTSRRCCFVDCRIKLFQKLPSWTICAADITGTSSSCGISRDPCRTPSAASDDAPLLGMPPMILVSRKSDKISDPSFGPDKMPPASTPTRQMLETDLPVSLSNGRPWKIAQSMPR